MGEKKEDLKERPLTPSEALTPKETIARLEIICQQQAQQIEMLKTEYEKLRQEYLRVGNEAFYKRLDYLFRIVEDEVKGIFPLEFSESCRAEIINLMSIPEKEGE